MEDIDAGDAAAGASTEGAAEEAGPLQVHHALFNGDMLFAPAFSMPLIFSFRAQGSLHLTPLLARPCLAGLHALQR